MTYPQFSGFPSGNRRPPRRPNRFKPWTPAGMYLAWGAPYTTTIVAAVLLAGLVFTGLLLFRYNDRNDILARGKRLMAEGKVSLAVESFRNLVNKYPDSYDGHVALGRAYLDLSLPWKAEQEFRMASALKVAQRENAADVARSELLISQRRFNEAEDLLLIAQKKNAKDPDVKSGLFELYMRWGDYLNEFLGERTQAIPYYERALFYVSRYEAEQEIKDKLIPLMLDAAQNDIAAGRYTDAAKLMKRSITYRYDAQTLVALGNVYERQNLLDDAIAWYQKAFDTNPSLISIKLSNVLISKGKALQAKNEPEQAEQYFRAADDVLKKTNAKPSDLYPVTLSVTAVSPKFDKASGRLVPGLTVQVQNSAHRDIAFLKLRAEFYVANRLVAMAEGMGTQPGKLLKANGHADSLHTVKLVPSQAINVARLGRDPIKLKVYVAYSEPTTTTPDASLKTELQPANLSDWTLKVMEDIHVTRPKAPVPEAALPDDGSTLPTPNSEPT